MSGLLYKAANLAKKKKKPDKNKLLMRRIIHLSFLTCLAAEG